MTSDKLLKELSQASLILAVLAGLPYSLGAAADVLPPEGKKWITLIAGVSAALAKTTQLIISALSPPSPPTGTTPK